MRATCARNNRHRHTHLYCLTKEHALRRGCAECGAAIRVGRAAYCRACSAARDRQRTRDAARKQREQTGQAAREAWDRVAADLGTTPFTYTNSRGHRYFLHATTVAVLGGRARVRHYFARAPRPSELVDALPPGFEIAENPLTGLPLLKRLTEQAR